MKKLNIQTVSQGVKSFAEYHKGADLLRVKAIDIATATIIFGVVGAGKVKDATKETILSALRVEIGARAKDADGAGKYNSQLYAIVNGAGRNASMNSPFVKSLGLDRLKGMDIMTLLSELEAWRGSLKIGTVADYLTAINGEGTAANGTAKKSLFEQISNALDKKGEEMKSEEIEKLISRLSVIVSARKTAEMKAKVKASPKAKAKVKAAPAQDQAASA